MFVYKNKGGRKGEGREGEGREGEGKEGEGGGKDRFSDWLKPSASSLYGNQVE